MRPEIRGQSGNELEKSPWFDFPKSFPGKHYQRVEGCDRDWGAGHQRGRFDREMGTSRAGGVGAERRGRGRFPAQSRCRCCCSWARFWSWSRRSLAKSFGAIAGERPDGFAKVRPGMRLVDKEVGRFTAAAGLHV